jgi:hypothetical protein
VLLAQNMATAGGTITYFIPTLTQALGYTGSLNQYVRFLSAVLTIDDDPNIRGLPRNALSDSFHIRLLQRSIISFNRIITMVRNVFGNRRWSILRRARTIRFPSTWMGWYPILRINQFRIYG